MYNDAVLHVQMTQLQMFIIWQIVSITNTAHRQAIVQEYDNIQKLSTKRKMFRLTLKIFTFVIGGDLPSHGIQDPYALMFLHYSLMMTCT